ncbi:MAG: hypothetical protein ACMG6E_02125 [Candidatus Roizmanbacteria bacterium]
MKYMSERIIQKNKERNPHWCQTYLGLQRRLSALEKVVSTITETVPDGGLRDDWQGHWGHMAGTIVVVRPVQTPETQEVKVVMRQHRNSCDACVAHFSQKGA